MKRNLFGENVSKFHQIPMTVTAWSKGRTLLDG